MYSETPVIRHNWDKEFSGGLARLADYPISYANDILIIKNTINTYCNSKYNIYVIAEYIRNNTMS